MVEAVTRHQTHRPSRKRIHPALARRIRQRVSFAILGFDVVNPSDCLFAVVRQNSNALSIRVSDRSLWMLHAFQSSTGSAWELWKLLRGSKRIVLHESEFIPRHK